MQHFGLRTLPHAISRITLQIRAIPDVGRVVVPLSGRYACQNPCCPLVLASAKKAAMKNKVEVADDGWDEATTQKWCPNGATFNTQDDRYGNAFDFVWFLGYKVGEARLCVKVGISDSAVYSRRIHPRLWAMKSADTCRCCLRRWRCVYPSDISGKVAHQRCCWTK